MVVNGVSWPVMEVAPAIYRFRLLNGCNSRFLNLALKDPGGSDVPFYQIGTEQSLMPQVVQIKTGFATPLPGNGRDVCKIIGARNKSRTMVCVTPQPASDPQQALLLGLAERADTIVDFRGYADGTVITMVNTAPDAPFGGFPDIPADPATSGQVMQFVVKRTLLGTGATDPVLADGVTRNPNAATPPASLLLGQVDAVSTYPANVGGTSVTRDLALIEKESEQVCVSVDPTGAITYIDLGGLAFDPLDPASICAVAGGVPFAPMEAVLGINGSLGAPTSADPALNTGAIPTMWMDPIATNPALGATEAWELWNWTMDAHPIHLHLVKFKVLGRRNVDGVTPSIVPGTGVQPWENGWKDTVIAYPNEVTTLAATFDIEGLYVWHCHIVEHEDNEMMVPYCVGNPAANGCAGL
jgi:FtsP/CotA-like multicopper oxidase with cupredoxin domain